MPAVSIVQFERADLPFGKAMTDREDWHRTTADWERLLRLEPKGAFKAVVGGKDAGVAAVLCYDKVAWIHSVIVAKEHRDRDVGSELMRACMAYARRRGANCLKLDSIPEAKPFYSKHGFKVEARSLRMTCHGAETSTVAEKMTPRDLLEVAAFDMVRTGLDRKKVLSEVYLDNPGFDYIVREPRGVRGYIMGSKGDIRVNLGPCVCRSEDEECAEMLYRSALSEGPEQTYRICVYDGNPRAANLARRLGFKEVAHSIRMYKGTRFVESDSNYAMISPEKG